MAYQLYTKNQLGEIVAVTPGIDERVSNLETKAIELDNYKVDVREQTLTDEQKKQLVKNLAGTFLPLTSKAQSAKVADSANSVLGSNVNGAVSQATHASSAHSADNVPWSGVSNKPTIPSMWSYGTGDLTAGSSRLETGKLHFVYE